MPTVGDLLDFLCELAPVYLADDGDNIGLLVGGQASQISAVICALDITDDVVSEALDKGAGLIISHHSVIYKPLDCITDDNCPVVLRMIRHGISAICMHTNLDRVRGGVNDELARRLGLQNVRALDDPGGPSPLLRVGEIDEMPARDFAAKVKNDLGARSVKYVDGGSAVKRVCVGGGACGDYLAAVMPVADAFVTSDLKYHHFCDAARAGFTLVDAGHFATENVVIAPLAERVKERFPEISVDISQRLQDPVFCV